MIGKLTITRDYVIFGSKLNEICSNSYEVRKLSKPKRYHKGLLFRESDKINKHDIYQLILENGSCKETNTDELLILIETQSLNRKQINKTYVRLLSSKNSKGNGSFGLGNRVINWSKNSSTG